MARTTIAHGVRSLQVPGYVTIKTGKYSADNEKVEVSIKYGNKEDDLGLFGWQKMHGVRVNMRDNAYKQTTIYDDNHVTIRTTGEWKVAVESPE